MTIRTHPKFRPIGGYPLYLAVFLASAVGTLAEDAPEKTPPPNHPAKFTDPVSTYRTYINAVRKTDLAAARNCFTISDDNKSGALDVLAGLWTSTRRLNQIATKKFGAEAARSSLEPLGFSRGDLSDAALDLTEERLADARVGILGDDTAELVIKWREDDGYPDEAFEFQGDDPIHFSKVKGAWKINANKRIGGLSGKELLAVGTWGSAFRDHVTIADKASDQLTKGTLKSPAELKEFLARESSAAEARYKEAVEGRR